MLERPKFLTLIMGPLKSQKTNNSGIALFLVLWILTLLSVIVGEFCHAMRTEVNITRNFKEQVQTYYLAHAGLSRAISELMKTETRPARNLPISLSPNEPPDEPESLQWRINTLIGPVSFADGQFNVLIGNEGGKININKAGDRLLKMVLDRFELDDQDKAVIIDSILDWKDKDNLHRLNGAEDDYYMSLEKPYPSKDGDFESVEELLLVKGITPEIFYGGLKELLTVHPGDNKKSRKSSPKKRSRFDKININYALPTMLRSLPEMTDELVDGIIEFRKEKDLNMPDLLEIVGPDVYSSISPYVSTSNQYKSPVYSITSEGFFEGSPVKQKLKVLLEIDVTTRKKYRILQWLDTSEDSLSG